MPTAVPVVERAATMKDGVSQVARAYGNTLLHQANNGNCAQRQPRLKKYRLSVMTVAKYTATHCLSEQAASAQNRNPTRNRNHDT